MLVAVTFTRLTYINGVNEVIWLFFDSLNYSRRYPRVVLYRNLNLIDEVASWFLQLSEIDESDLNFYKAYSATFRVAN